MKKRVIAIDGPAASGKSSVASALAERLGAIHINTGSMYRAVAWKAMKNGIDWNQDPEAFEAMLKETSMKFLLTGGKEPVLQVDGEIPGEALRTPDAARNASAVATLAPVRKRLVELQRAMAGETLLVMEGRDIGSAVFPDAEYKFFLTASPEERAVRRLLQEGGALTQENIRTVAADVEARDQQDRTRKLSPLVQTEDAILIDNTGKSPEETLQMFLSHIRKAE